jgi:S-adenosylmethionine decarboxylase
VRVERGEYAELRRLEAFSAKMLYAVDARSTGSPALADVDRLAEVATAAVEAGAGHVLETSAAVFPNGGLTLVLILAESHLSIHTWPEENLVAIDLFSCGSIDGARALDELVAALSLTDIAVRSVPRGQPAGQGAPAAPDR